MKKFKIALALATALTSVQALEFGTMGSQAFGMGGVGVAIKHSPWGLYYNPALMAADDGFKVGLYVGFQSKSDNFFDLFDINKNDPSALLQSKLEELTKNSSIKLTNQDGAVIQLPDFGIGVLATGAFINAGASGSARLENVTANNLKDAKLTTDYSVYTLLEIPVGYALEFETVAGDFSIGVTGKYMNLSATNGSFAIQNGTNVSDAFKNMMKFDIGGGDSNFGLDLGLSYEIADCFTMGVVGKYLNSPTFNTKNGSYTIAPQARAGVALDLDWFMLGMDVDATANKDLSNENFKTQMIGLGTAFDFEWIALRGGIATDLQHTDDMIFSLGLGITFLDIGVQFGKKTSPLNGIQMPDYFALQVGAGFSF
ncbi:MAG TPA: conjugal transfer protein TraF [Candidatus Helicobacter avistercoris]|nr:conjugal transfer protein TraF [Candidatus Helicobacter avistercoris]